MRRQSHPLGCNVTLPGQGIHGRASVSSRDDLSSVAPVLFLDLETRSATDLKRHGVYRYVADPEFKILMAGWHDGQMNGDVPKIHVSTGAAMFKIPGLLDPKVKIVAHNAQFERLCLTEQFGPFFDAERFIDTAALAAEAGYPRALDKLAKALDVEGKDSAGTRLINLFSKPKRDGTFVQPDDKPEQWLQFQSYCGNDVRTLIDVYHRLPPLSEPEQWLWLLDQKINDRGIPVDFMLTKAAVAASDANRQAEIDEARGLTGVENPNSTTQLLGWLNTEGGLNLPDLTKETVETALALPTIHLTTRRVLEIRQSLALVASNKYAAAVRQASEDGRYRGAFTFHGAHTGRWTGGGVQFHNLPRAQFKDGEGEHDLTAESAAILDLILTEQMPAEDLKKLIRAMFIGPFTVVDFSAIEARILAWMAGEEWMLQAFREGRDLYVETGKRMGGLDRQKGKSASLGLGYQGKVAALRKVGAEGTDAELGRLANRWRAAAPAIVRFWYQLQDTFWTGGVIGPVRIEKVGRDRLVHLPSGRTLTYHDVRMIERRLTYADPRGYRNDTYGGALTENLCQAIARDLLAVALFKLDAFGYPIVGHVHDEVIIEGAHPVDEIVKVMCDLPGWADGLPMEAAGFVCERYRKG